MPGPVRNRHSGTPDLGAGPGRIRGGLANPQWAPDRESDRFADDGRSGGAGGHAGLFGPYPSRLLYRLPFVLLAVVPHGEDQRTVRDERRFRTGLCLFGGYGRTGLSPL